MNTVLITGGAGGIGAEIARTFAREGYRVFINYYSSVDAAKAMETEIGCTAVYADISNPEDVDKMFEATGDIDILINNAGISRFHLFTDISNEDWDKMMGINLNGAFYCTKAALKTMINKKQGKIINISSIWGICGASCEVAYSTAKAGLIGMTKALAKELGPSNIQVNCVAPGVIDTKMNSLLDKDTIDALVEETPLGVLGQPKDVAELVYYLASPKGNFITGQIISPNGGFLI